MSSHSTPSLTGIYVYDVRYTGRSDANVNAASRRKRQMARQRRNRKVRAQPLLLPPDALSVAAEACEKPDTNPQKQSPLFSKLPPEVRALIWKHLFADVDLHVRHQGIQQLWPDVPTVDAGNELLIYPCLDHALISHTKTMDDALPLSPANNLNAFPYDSNTYDLDCWPHYHPDVSTAWPSARRKRREIRRMATVLGVVRCSRLVQLETLRALAKAANICSTCRWPNSQGLDHYLPCYLPFRSQRSVGSILHAKRCWEWRKARVNASTTSSSSDDEKSAQINLTARDLACIYGPFLKGGERLKLVAVDFRGNTEWEKDEGWTEWVKWLGETVRGCREFVREVEVVVVGVPAERLVGLEVPGGVRCRFSAFGRVKRELREDMLM